MSNYDDWKTATPPYLEGDDSTADAAIEMENANDRWLRDNYEKIRDLREDWHRAMVDAWEGETREDFDEDLLPYNDIDAAYDAAGMLVARHDKAMRNRQIEPAPQNFRAVVQDIFGLLAPDAPKQEERKG